MSSPSSNNNNTLAGRPAEYLKTMQRRMHKGEIQYLLRFRVEGEADVKVWRSAAGLKQDKPLLRAFLQSRKSNTTPTPQPGQAVDCVICYSFGIEDASHRQNDVCAACWAPLTVLSKANRTDILINARQEYVLSQAMFSMQLAESAAAPVTGPAPVAFMTVTCPAPVAFMTVTGPAPVAPMTVTGPAPVAFMTVTGPAPVAFMTVTGPAPVAFMTVTGPAPVAPMTVTGPAPVAFMTVTGPAPIAPALAPQQALPARASPSVPTPSRNASAGHALYNLKSYRDRKQAGLCPVRGCNKSLSGAHVYCEFHLADFRTRGAAYRAARR